MSFLKQRITGAKLAVLAMGTISCALFPALGQGTLIFDTRVPGIVDAPVFCADGVTLAGPVVAAQLWGGPEPGSLEALYPATVFGTGAQAGYVVAPSELVTVPGVPEGGMAFIQLRVWDHMGGSLAWAEAFSRAESNLIVVGPLGGETVTAPYLEGLMAFQGGLLCIPEPSTGLLALLGLTLGAAIRLRGKTWR